LITQVAAGGGHQGCLSTYNADISNILSIFSKFLINIVVLLLTTARNNQKTVIELLLAQSAFLILSIAQAIIWGRQSIIA